MLVVERGRGVVFGVIIRLRFVSWWFTNYRKCLSAYVMQMDSKKN